MIRKYLWYYSHYYQLIILVVYLLLLDKNETEAQWLAIIIYVISVIVNVIRYYFYLKSKEK